MRRILRTAVSAVKRKFEKKVGYFPFVALHVTAGNCRTAITYTQEMYQKGQVLNGG